ncbi:MAG TPA: hypothetical protein VHO69_14210 [Phototrophicaceae bacterium]|nr:hypothetical protein [Phototrophicaceae bacterium]
MNPNHNPDRRLFWLLILLALVFYSLPWITTLAVSLNMGGYDLAEWASLHPAVRAASPPLLASLLLRLPLAWLAWIIAFTTKREAGWWLHALLTGLLAVALLPPLLEFFTGASGDPNYQQQFALGLITLVVGLGGLSGRLARWNTLIIPGLALLGLLTGLWGLILAYNLLNSFGLPATTGFGGLGLSFCYAGLLLLYQPITAFKTNRVAST